MLCVDNFTYSNRRHHCRFCGILCCDLCSTKKLQLGALLLDPLKPHSPPNKSSSKSNGSSSSSSLGAASRVCDGCFNSLLFECDSWKQAKKKLERMEAVCWTECLLYSLLTISVCRSSELKMRQPRRPLRAYLAAPLPRCSA